MIGLEAFSNQDTPIWSFDQTVGEVLKHYLGASSPVVIIVASIFAILSWQGPIKFVYSLVTRGDQLKFPHVSLNRTQAPSPLFGLGALFMTTGVWVGAQRLEQFAVIDTPSLLALTSILFTSIATLVGALASTGWGGSALRRWAISLYLLAVTVDIFLLRGMLHQPWSYVYQAFLQKEALTSISGGLLTWRSGLETWGLACWVLSTWAVRFRVRSSTAN